MPFVPCPPLKRLDRTCPAAVLGGIHGRAHLCVPRPEKDAVAAPAAAGEAPPEVQPYGSPAGTRLGVRGLLKQRRRKRRLRTLPPPVQDTAGWAVLPELRAAGAIIAGATRAAAAAASAAADARRTVNETTLSSRSRASVFGTSGHSSSGRWGGRGASTCRWMGRRPAGCAMCAGSQQQPVPCSPWRWPRTRLRVGCSSAH